jgi:hypothetical protein
VGTALKTNYKKQVKKSPGCYQPRLFSFGWPQPPNERMTANLRAVVLDDQPKTMTLNKTLCGQSPRQWLGMLLAITHDFFPVLNFAFLFEAKLIFKMLIVCGACFFHGVAELVSD